MKKIIFTLILSFLFSILLKGQNGNYIGGSFNIGGKSIYNLAGIAVQTRLMNHFDLDFGGSMSYFNGFGYSGGINFVPLKTKLQPFIGVQYGKSFGGEIDITAKGKDASYYDISPIEFLYLKSGLMIKLDPNEGDEDKNRLGFLVFTFSYRESISNYTIEHISGPTYENESFFNAKMSNGIGFNFSLIVLFGMNK